MNKQFPKYLVYFSADVYVPTVDESKIPTNLTEEQRDALIAKMTKPQAFLNDCQEVSLD